MWLLWEECSLETCIPTLRFSGNCTNCEEKKEDGEGSDANLATTNDMEREDDHEDNTKDDERQ